MSGVEDSDVEDTDATAIAGPTQRPGAGMPRWVKVFIAVAAAVVALIVVTQLIGGGHGPGRHDGGDPPATDDGGHRPPIDHTP